MPRTARREHGNLDAIVGITGSFCRQGEHLLTLATPTELVAFRRWYLEEFERQVAGEPPTPWHAYLASHGG